MTTHPNALLAPVPVEDFLAPEAPDALFARPLPDELATAVVERLKSEADRHWYIDPRISLTYAGRIVSIGQARNDQWQIALGLMARGDAIKMTGSLEEAWNDLEASGRLFQSIGDEVGWARTRIGQLFVGQKLNRLGQILPEVERARRIFEQHGEGERLLRLTMNLALFHSYQRNCREALRVYDTALEIAHSLHETGAQYLGGLYLNIALTHASLGDFDRALELCARARAEMLRRGERWHLATADINAAWIARRQGQYRLALQLLHGVIEQTAVDFPEDASLARQQVATCYLGLNRFADARDLARQVLAEQTAFKDQYEVGYTLIHLAAAEAELANYAAALTALDEAEAIFTATGARPVLMQARLLRGRIHYRQNDLAAAERIGAEVAEFSQAQGHQIEFATATLLEGRVALAFGEAARAEIAGQHALRIGRLHGVTWLCYAAHLLLGQVAERIGDNRRAERRYRAAVATVERLQRSLTVTLRADFLEDKGEALQALIALCLRANRFASAFEALERAKSQAWLSFLLNRERLVWSHGDARSRGLLDRLQQLRAEHEGLQALMGELPRNPDHPSGLTPQQASVEIRTREAQIRQITEQLYLFNSADPASEAAPIVTLPAIQHALEPDTLLLEFYDAGDAWWVFAVSTTSITSHRLEIQTDQLTTLLTQLQTNIGAALQVGVESVSQTSLVRLGQRLLHQLYRHLIEPLDLAWPQGRRLIFVPYGALHYLPFHLLHDGAGYLIERCEVVVTPSAGLLTRARLQRPRGALALAHSWEGRLPNTHTEAVRVQGVFGGDCRTEGAALRSVLAQPPQQILHIAAHGQHRLDQPDLSFIQLADGQLYADDLMQHDLSYELITLSACETGQAQVRRSEDLIGLGRGFLYAGAGALLTSLWPVADAVAIRLMDEFYRALNAGCTKAAALRQAQRLLLNTTPHLHPAYWGAFQLVGDAGPLSG